jgi:hypothetical protein
MLLLQEQLQATAQQQQQQQLTWITPYLHQ